MCVKPPEEPRALFGVPTAIPDPLKAATNPRVHAAYDDDGGNCIVSRSSRASNLGRHRRIRKLRGFSASSTCDEVVVSDWLGGSDLIGRFLMGMT